MKAEPEKRAGRNQFFTPPPVKLLAEKHNIPVEQPEKIMNEALRIKNYEPDLIIVAAYGQILPKEILDLPKYGCLNVHPSLLPKYRGPSPIQAAILNNDEETGVTIMKMDDKIDHGAILASEKRKAKSETLTYLELHDELAKLGAEILIKTIPDWVAGEIKPQTQDETKATYTKIMEKQDGKIDWTKSAEEIERQVRALNPWPSAYALDNDKKMIKILKAGTLTQTESSPAGEPGKTFQATNEEIAVQTGKDYLIIKELQPEGKKPMPSAAFLRGHPDFIGTMLK